MPEFAFAHFNSPAAAPVVADSGPSAADAHDAVLEALAEARAEADALRAAARDEGLQQARAEAIEALQPAAAALEQAAAALAAEAGERAERLEAEAVGFALALAEKVVGGALAVQPERVLEAVRGALRGMVERERVTVLVHPDDLGLVREAMTEMRAGLGGIEHCEVQAERRVARGGAVVRTPEGEIDARLDTKLARAREAVESCLRDAEDA